jgi:hypothetical protein
MDKKKIRKLWQRLRTYRSRVANLRSQELVSFAIALGRERSSRGKEPTFVSRLLPYSRPITIPNHPGSLKKFTAGSILDAFEQDLLTLEERLSTEKGDKP